jgi:protein-tyrosine phosphatase
VFNRILMVCTGNICRSPIAEVLLAARLGQGRAVESAGIHALVGWPADAVARELMAERGLDLAPHRARQLTAAMVRSADLILVMEEGQRREVEALDPSARGRVHRLGRIGGFDVPDPYQQGRGAFEHATKLIERGLDEMEKAFWSGA